MKRLKLPLLYLLSLLLSILPIAVYVIVNRERYVTTSYEAIRLGLGMIAACAFLLMKALGKLRAPARLHVFFAVLVMSYLLESVLDDLLALSALALLGELLDTGVQALIARERRKSQREEMGELARTVIDTYTGRA